MVKEVFQRYQVPSQVVTRRNAEKFGLSKASNVLKQINVKAGGDLYEMQFPKAMDLLNTMLIGIDVCHAGPRSVVGFAASINKPMSQYYSQYLIQKRGQEIVETQMKQALQNAIAAFKKQNGGKLPTNFIIYRDGVGDA